MTPGERAAKRYETMRGLAKLDGETVHGPMKAGVCVRCRYRRVPRNHTLHEEYRWFVKREGETKWKRTGVRFAIDLIRTGYEVEDEI